MALRLRMFQEIIVVADGYIRCLQGVDMHGQTLCLCLAKQY